MLFILFYFWKKGHRPLKNRSKKFKIWNLRKIIMQNAQKNSYKKILKNKGARTIQSQRII